ncbi:hypothetical protein CR513_20175, partial [Mucuna pruriens]
MGLYKLVESSRFLYGFSGERVPILGMVELDTVFGEGPSTRIIPILYTVVEAETSYNIIMGRPALNRLRADSHMVRKCYEDSLKVGLCAPAANALSLELDPRQNERERPHLVGELKEVQIGPQEV